MTLYVAIALGLTNLNLPSVQKELGRYTSEKRFRVEKKNCCDFTIPSFEDGCLRAEELATTMALKYHAPLSIGVVMVRFTSENPAFSPARMDIAVLIVKGELVRRPAQLTPVMTRKDCMGLLPCETKFNTEGCLNLVESIRLRRQALNLV